MLCLIAAIVWGFAFSFQETASNSEHLIDAFRVGFIFFAHLTDIADDLFADTVFLMDTGCSGF